MGSSSGHAQACHGCRSCGSSAGEQVEVQFNGQRCPQAYATSEVAQLDPPHLEHLDRVNKWEAWATSHPEGAVSIGSTSSGSSTGSLSRSSVDTEATSDGGACWHHPRPLHRS
mmetsp:Transcript_83055/g.185392  ORF Transcript_83055/g.185392 Transcript_83055/m.185392 type:complete len:113 (-) Transcript_83055:140-478(-)